MASAALDAGGAGGAEPRHAVLVATREALAAPSSVSLPEPAPAPGLILPDGSINWGCPCLGGMATGPCGNQFREAFSCFHYSEAEPKGSDCYEKFSVMQGCMADYPELYGRDDDELAAALDGAGEPAGDRGGDRPGGERPGGERPGGDRPGGERPGGDRPGGERPGGDRPGEDQEKHS